jgi:GDP-4-dehydro-6-deoxy-D-mannose reductase
MAQRVLAVKRGQATVIPAGNVDLSRDIGDVRDVVRAYRLLLEALAAGRLGGNPIVINVATGRAETIRSLIEQLCALAGITAAIQVDPALVRVDDPPEIRGDASLLTELTGWRPEVPLKRTLTDLLAEAQTGDATRP